MRDSGWIYCWECKREAYAAAGASTCDKCAAARPALVRPAEDVGKQVPCFGVKVMPFHYSGTAISKMGPGRAIPVDDPGDGNTWRTKK